MADTADEGSAGLLLTDLPPVVIESPAALGKPGKPGKKPKKSKPAKPAPPPSIADQHLEYLRKYKDDKASWKFNKNSQTLLIKYVFIKASTNQRHK